MAALLCVDYIATVLKVCFVSKIRRLATTHSVTDRQTAIQTDNIIMPIA